MKIIINKCWGRLYETPIIKEIIYITAVVLLAERDERHVGNTAHTPLDGKTVECRFSFCFDTCLADWMAKVAYLPFPYRSLISWWESGKVVNPYTRTQITIRCWWLLCVLLIFLFFFSSAVCMCSISSVMWKRRFLYDFRGEIWSFTPHKGQ